MKTSKSMASLVTGEAATILAVAHPSRAMESRLRLLGFSEGSAVRRVGESPDGKMISFSVMGAVIALRDVDSSYVSVMPVRHKSEGCE